MNKSFDTELAQIGKRIYRRRVELGVSGTELAASASISVSTLSNVENGQRNISVKSFCAIAKALEVPLSRLQPVALDEAIIDRDTWDIVQRAREQRRRPTKSKEVALFSGMVYCADCGARLYVSRTNRENATKEWYNCAHYRSRQGCTPHHITGNALRILVLQNLQRVIAYAEVDEADFVKRVIENKASLRREERNAARRKLEKAERRIGELDTIIQKLYEDNVIGKLTDERFAKMSAAYEKEQRELQESASALRSILEEADAVSVNIESFLDMVKKYTDPTELTPALLHELVEKIVVHEGDKSSGHRVQQIDVYYNFIGEIYLSPESARTGSLQVR